MIRLCDVIDDAKSTFRDKFLCKEVLSKLLDSGYTFSEEKTESAKKIISDTVAVEKYLRQVIGSVGERRTCAAFDVMVALGGAEGFVRHPSLSPIKSMVREKSFPCGRVDRMTVHEDGSITLIEIKQQGSRRDIATAIGQVVMYGAAAKQLISATDYHLATCVSGERDKWIEAACESVGVEYITLDKQSHKIIDAMVEGYFQEICSQE